MPSSYKGVISSYSHSISKGLVFAAIVAFFSFGGIFVSKVLASSEAVLGVTQITATQTYATADNTYSNGWKWVFNVTVPSNQTLLKMKFADWVSGSNIIPAGGNIRFYSAQSTNAADEAHAIPITASSTWSDLMFLNPLSDLDVLQGGRQIEITVEAKVPTGSAGGSYSTSYGINTTATSTITISDTTQTYDSIQKPVTITTDPSSLAMSITYTGIDVSYSASTTPPIHAGHYSVTAIVTDPGYTGTSSATLTISPAPVSVVADPQTKVYDGSTATDPVLTYVATPSTLFGSDTFAGSLSRDPGESFGDYTITQGSLILDSDYVLTYNSNIFRITQASLTISGLSADNKVYDATTDATISGTPILDGLFGNDDVSLVDNHTASFADKNFGNDKPVTVTGYSLSGTDSGNYILTQPTGLTANIAQAPIAASVTADTKTYDATDAAVVHCTPAIILGNDTVTCSAASASFSDKNVNDGKTVTATGITLSGGDSGNYDLTDNSTTTTANITKADLAVTATGINKVYDGTTNATVNLTTDKIGNDDVTATNTSASFDTKDVGTGKTVTVYGITINGGDSGNYNLTDASTTTTADIASSTLTISGLSADNKVYDATTDATISGTPILDGLFGNDDVSLVDNHTASFADKNFGNDKPVTVTGYSLSGTDSGNYILTQPTGLTANIAQAPIAASVTADTKTYDATDAAVVHCTPAIILGNDTVTCSAASASFSDKNVNDGKTVTATGITLSGGDSGNYDLTDNSTTTTANITKADLAVTATGINKVYDGTTNATVNLTTDKIGNDDVTATNTSASFDTKDVGTGKTVTVYGITINGGDSGNYNLTDASTTTTADIASSTLTISGLSADNKVYDATTDATISGTPILDGLFGNDDVSLVDNHTASFADKNFGNDKPVTVTGYSLSGTDSGNYILTQPTGLTANIAQAPIAASVTADTKTYDATDAAVVHCTPAIILGNDTVTCSAASASFSDKNVNDGKTVTATGITLSGGDSGNYDLTDNSTTTTANITKADLAVTATGINKVYDGTTNATVNLTTDKIGNDDVTATNTSASFDTKDVGTGKTVTVYGITINGGDSGNYNLTDASTTTTADIKQATPLLYYVTTNVADGDDISEIITTLNAYAYVGSHSNKIPGLFTFDPSSGIVNGKVGTPLNIIVSFAPTDSTNYSAVSQIATFNIVQN